MTETMTRARPASFDNQLREMEVNDTIAKVRAVPDKSRVSELPALLTALKTQMRNVLNPGVRRAREATGNQYTVEIADVVMPNGTLYCVAVVTRTE